MNEENKDKAIAMRVSRNSIIVNLLLAIGKLFCGIFGKSGAMISDAVHSASDVFSTIVVIIGINLSSKESDEKHQYGHERLECVAAIILACILAGTGIAIGYSGVLSIVGSSNGGEISIPTTLPLVAAIVSVFVKEGMYWYTIFAAKKIDSGALKADAWHHRSDALSSIGSFVGILGAILGYPILDPVASVIICAFVLKAAIDIFKDAVGKMTDEALDAETVLQIRKLVLSVDGVINIDEIKTRTFGNKAYVDVEILVDGKLMLKEAHDIAQEVHDKVENSFDNVKHCMIHVNPN